MRPVLISRLGWSLPGITILLSSFIHLVSGDARDFPFFISEADYPGIQRWVFTLGFTLNGMVLMYYSWLLFTANRERARWYWMHISLMFGIWVGANLCVLSFMDMYDHIEIHVAAALNIFYFGLGWCVVTHIALKNASPTGKKIRYFSVCTAATGLFGLVYSINLGLQKYPEFVDGDWDMAKMQPYIDWAAPMEYLLAFSFIATLYSFETELNGDEEE